MPFMCKQTCCQFCSPAHAQCESPHHRASVSCRAASLEDQGGYILRVKQVLHETAEKWFITLIQLWHKNEKQLTSNTMHNSCACVCLCVFFFFIFTRNPKSNIDASCDCSEHEMKMCHLFHNPDRRVY